MLPLALLLAVHAPPAFGSVYPSATLDGAPEWKFCDTRYRFSTAEPIDAVAAYYRAEAAAADVPVLDDTARKFVDYRMLTFVAQPKFMTVLLSRKGGRTSARVAFHTRVAAGC